MNVSRLADAVDVVRDTAHFHVRRLEQAGIVVCKDGEKGNQRLCFLSWDEDLWRDPRTRILFGGKAPRNVAIAVLEEPGLSTTEVAEELGFSPRSARRHLKTLEEYGLVDRTRVGRAKEAHPRPPLERWREEVGERFWVDEQE